MAKRHRLFDFLPSGLSPDRSLMARLVGSFLTVSLLTVLFVALVAFFEARRALREAMFDRLTAVAVEKEGELNRWVDIQRDIVVFLASLPQVRDDAALLASESGENPQMTWEARTRLRDLFKSAMGPRSDLEQVFVLAPVGGRVVASTNAANVGDYRVDELFYTEGKEDTFIQNVYASPVTGQPVFTMATPIRGSSGETIAVLAADLDLVHVDRVIADRTGLAKTGEAYLVSPFNDFVSSERFGREEYRRGVFSTGIQKALAGESGVGLYENYAGVPVLGAYRWNEDRELALLVELGQSEAFEPARSLVSTIVGMGMASAFVLAVGVFMIARQVARPVLEVTKAATAVAEGDFTTVAPVLTTDEVGLLAKSFNEMTARLRRLYADLNEQVETTTKTMVALEKSQYLLQAIIDNSTTLIAVTDQEDRFLLLNKSFEAALGVSQSRALGKTPVEVLQPGAAKVYLSAVREALDDRRVAERTMAIPVDDDDRTFILVAFPLRAEGVDPYGVGVIATDLTEIRRAQEAHQLLEAQVQHAQKLESLGLMAGGIAHDFNNILTSVLGNTELALHLTESGTRARVYLEKVVAATKQASELTSQMLAYAGKGDFNRESLDLNELLTEMTQLVRASISKRVSFRLDLTSLQTTIRANRAQVTQLVMNLITNAAEAMADDAGTVTVKTRRIGGPHGPVQLAVDDTGAGMSERTRERIFDPFFSTKGPGRGLGLAAVQGIVKSAGGELRVRSTPGEGSTFEVTFPISADPAESDAPSEARRDEPTMGGRVLVVDDEPTVRQVARNLLEAAGYSVVEARDGSEALRRYREEGGAVEAVLLDMTMPGQSGAETLEELRALDRDARIILTSGYDEEDTVAKLQHEEKVEFLQKPYRARTLLDKLASVLEARTVISSSGRKS